jgi:predicted DNA-binding helix-hairpin-helix protein
VSLTNDIMGDAELRKNYQVWQVFYSTNMPIFESRFQMACSETSALLTSKRLITPPILCPTNTASCAA